MTAEPEHPISDDDIRDAIRATSASPGARHDARILEAARFAAAGHRAEASRARRRWLVPGLAVAAMLIVAVGLWRFVLPGTALVDDGAAIRSGVMAVTPADGAQLDAMPRRLAWPAQVGASAYRVIIFDTDGEPLWTSADLTNNELAVNEPLAAILRPDSTYLWLVEVEGEVARRELGPFAFHIAGE